MLLLLRRGSERAKSLLLNPDLEPSVLQSNEGTLRSSGSIWLSARLQSGQAVYSEFKSSAPGGVVGLWNYLAGDVIKVITAWRGREDFDDVRGDLRSLYRKIRKKVLVQSPRESFFHAKKTRVQKDGMVTLTYDFSTREQLLDFYPVGETENVLQWDKSRKSVHLQGEFRILMGEPFQDVLRVSGVAKFLFEEAPNVNLALWTHEEDTVTCPNSDKIDLTGKTRSEPEAGDYFVLAHGYRLLGCIRAAKRKGIRYDRNRLPLYFFQPTFAVISGYRGMPLHRNVLSELIWEIPVDDRLKGTVRFDVSIKGGKLKWTVNKFKPPFREVRKLDRLARNAPHSGSVTLFTNASEVELFRIEIQGKMRPEWFRLRAGSRAREELKRLEQ